MASKIGTFLRQQREKSEMSLEDVAKDSPITASTIGSIESGEIETPSMPVLRAFAKIYNVSVDRLVGMLDKEPAENVSKEHSKMYGEMEVPDESAMGATSFGQLIEAEKARESAKVIKKRSRQLADIVENIMFNPMIEDKGKALSTIGNEFSIMVAGEMAKERWQPLTDKAVNLIADHTKQEEPMKTEGGIKFPASDFAYAPDPDKPSTWKLRLAEGEPGNITRSQLGAAAAAFSPGGFRGQKVDIPSSDVSKVKSKIRSAYRKLGVDDKDMPSGIKKELANRNNFILTKQANGQYRWLAIYSNKFRDRDNPPEIISEASHINFVKQVNSGELPYPELWLWHIKESKWGIADFVGWDDSGFAIASGTVDKGKEWIAETLSQNTNLLTSHGMSIKSIKRDPNDPTIIIEHRTKEISPLLSSAAANEYTGFILDNEVKEMALSQQDKAKLSELGIDPERLESETEDKAKETEGLEFKEIETEDKEQEFVTKGEIEDLIKSIADSTNKLVEVSSSLAERINKLEENKLTVDKEIAERTPAASLSDLYKSVIGSEETKIDGRSALAKSGPEEAPSQQFGSIADIIVQRNREIERGSVQ